MMQAIIPADELQSLNASIASLKRSTFRTAPMFVIGIFATLLAAGFALYYIFDLSARLQAAQYNFGIVSAKLDAAERSLAEARAALRAAQSAKPSNANAKRIDSAIAEVSRSQDDLKTASSSLKEAVEKLPTEPKGRTAENLTVEVSQMDLLQGLRLRHGRPTNRVIQGSPIRPVTVWLELPQAAKSSVRSVRYNFYHRDWDNPKLGGNASAGYPVSWNGWGCINQADVTATLKNGREVRAEFNLCDLWDDGRVS